MLLFSYGESDKVINGGIGCCDTLSSCSRIHEWRSSSRSRCFSANETTSSALSSQGFKAFSLFEKKRRSSNGSAISTKLMGRVD
jgi:hypothetical protein